MVREVDLRLMRVVFRFHYATVVYMVVMNWTVTLLPTAGVRVCVEEMVGYKHPRTAMWCAMTVTTR